MKILKRLTWILAGVLVFVLAFGMLGQAVEASPPSQRHGIHFVRGELLGKFAPGAPADEIAEEYGGRVKRDIGGGWKLLRVPEGTEESKAKDFKSHPLVRFAELNFIRQHCDEPVDPLLSEQWALDNTGGLVGLAKGDISDPDADMDWPEARDYLSGTTLNPVAIAIIGSGIDANHPDLNAKLWINSAEDGGNPELDDDKNGYVDDINGYDFLYDDPTPDDTLGHETHVSGIAAAATDNGEGIAGVAWDNSIKIMVLKAGDEGGMPVSAMAEAIRYAVNNGAKVISISWGGRWSSRTERDAINYAWENGVIITASAGNEGGSRWVRKIYPAAYDNVMAVIATNWHDERAPYSSYGSWCSVSAPGGDMNAYHDPGGILSTMPTYDCYYTTEYPYNKDYDQMQGTSMAAPQVAGLAALLFSYDPSLSNTEVRSVIEATCDDLGTEGFDKVFANGRININKALRSLAPADNPPSVKILSPDGTTPICGTVTIEVNASDTEDADGSLTVKYAIDVTDPETATWITMDYSDQGTIYQKDWDTAIAAEGSHTIHAKATDSANQTTYATEVSVTVDNVDNLPMVSIMEPEDKSTIRGEVTITANVTNDGYGTITAVQYTVDGGKTYVEMDYDEALDIYTKAWETAAYPDDGYTITVRATDRQLPTTEWATDSVSVTVCNEVAVLSVTAMTTDRNGDPKASFSKLERVYILVTVTDESYNPVLGAMCQIAVTDPAGVTVYDKTLETSDQGEVFTYFRPGWRAKTGTYHVNVTATKLGYEDGVLERPLEFEVTSKWGGWGRGSRK